MYIGCGCTGCCRLGETPSGLSGELASGSAFTIYLIAAGSIPAARTIIGLALFSIQRRLRWRQWEYELRKEDNEAQTDEDSETKSTNNQQTETVRTTRKEIRAWLAGCLDKMPLMG